MCHQVPRPPVPVRRACAPRETAEQVCEPASLSSLSPSQCPSDCVLWLCYLLVTRLFGSRSCWLGPTTSRSSADPCSGNVRSGAGQGGGRGLRHTRSAPSSAHGCCGPWALNAPRAERPDLCTSGLLLPHCSLAVLGLAVRRPCSSPCSVCGWGGGR